MSNNSSPAFFITFYSFKGGVGRSMALINTASILAGRGFRVLVIDLDLEAPGLSYLNPISPDSKPTPQMRMTQLGFVDLLTDAKERGREADLFVMQPRDLEARYTQEFRLPPDLCDFKGGSLHIMPAGKFDDLYSKRFDDLNLQALYKDGLGEPLIRAFKKTIAESGRYDYVLVDSRTGFSDEAGVCTRDLADHLMILSGLNRQNVEGTSNFLRALRAETRQKARFQIILSPVPNGEDKLLDERETDASRAFGEAWGEPVDVSLQIPYHPQLALTEEPHIFRRRRGYLFEAYRKIEGNLLKAIGHDSDTLLGKIQDYIEKRNYRAALHELHRMIRLDKGLSALSDFASELSSRQFSPQQRKTESEPSQLRMTHEEILPSEGESSRGKITLEEILRNEDGHKVVEFIVNNLPVQQSTWGARSLIGRLGYQSPDLVKNLYRRMIDASPTDADILGDYAIFLDQCGDKTGADDHFQKAIAANPRHARNIGNYAVHLERRGDKDSAEAYYKQAVEVDPTSGWNLGNYAVFLVGRGKKDEAAVYFKQAVEADPKNIRNLTNYAFFLEWHCELKKEAKTYYRKAIAADPKNAWSLGNYAIFLNKHEDKDRADAYYKRAIAADPKNVRNLSSYAHFLRNHGDKDGAEVYYKKAIEEEPKNARILGSYATFLEKQRGNNNDAEVFYKQAIETGPNHAPNLGNYGQFLLGSGQLEKGNELLRSAWGLLDKSQCSNAAEFCFSLWIGLRMQKSDASRWERGFKFFLQQGFNRSKWDFARILEQAKTRLEPKEFEYAEALANAFLDESKIACLEQFDRWQILEPLDLFASSEDLDG